MPHWPTWSCFNLQQPEGRPRGHEPRGQEVDAGEVPQHEQVWGYQWAADEVRFLWRYKYFSPEGKGRLADRQSVAGVSDGFFSAASGGRTFQKVRRNKMGSTTSLNCRRSTLAEATWRPSRVLSVWPRWACWSGMFLTTSLPVQWMET